MAVNLFTDGRAVTALEVSRLAAATAAQTFATAGVGGAVTVNAAMTLNVSGITANTVMIASALVGTAYVASTVVIGASDPTNPRRDAIYYDTSGAVGVSAGVAAAVTATTGPVLPTLSATQFMLCEVYVGAGVTSIVSGNLTDRRQVANVPAISELQYTMGDILSTELAASATGTANTAYFIALPPITAPVTITKLRVNISISSGNVDLGIYTSVDGGATLVKLVTMGTTASPGTGQRDFDIADTTLYPGIRYWFAWAADNATVSLYRYGGAAVTLETGITRTKATSFVLPASIATATAADVSVAPMMYGLVSGGAVA